MQYNLLHAKDLNCYLSVLMVAQCIIVHINHNLFNQTSTDITWIVSNCFVITNRTVMSISTKMSFQISVVICLESIHMNNLKEMQI